MFKRCPISPKLRFSVLKRDGHRCQYCGARAPSVVLEIDHIRPVSMGGRNVIGNLVTACFDCNRGKHATTMPLYAQRAAVIGALMETPCNRPFDQLLPTIHAALDLFGQLDSLGEVLELAHRANCVEDWLSRSFQQAALDLNSEAIRWLNEEVG